MPEELPATIEGPARRRDTWSLRTLVEEVTGRPIEELQEPGRPWHPNLLAKAPSATGAVSSHPPFRSTRSTDEPFDPVGRVSPPLVGAIGRDLHGREHEHHAETLDRLRADPEPPLPGARPHPPGPSKRPERIYLHYLLLHLDRLSDTALAYLKHAVDEELAHRTTARAATAAPSQPPPPLVEVVPR